MISKKSTRFKEFSSRFGTSEILYLVLIAELINLSYFIGFFYFNSYLPNPFVWDKRDTFMDFYNPLFWVIKDGFYTTFKSVYPPINYFLLKVLSWGIKPNSALNAFDLRASHNLLSTVLCVIYLFILVLIINMGEWRKIKISNRSLVALACVLSTPVLFTLERGNLIFFAILLLALYLSAKNPWLRAIYLGLLINVKPYFVVLLIQYLNIYKLDIKFLLKAVLISISIFIFSGLIVDLNFKQFFSSYTLFSSGSIISIEGMLSLPNTIINLYSIKWVLVYGGATKITHSSYGFWFSLIKILGYLSVLWLIIISLIKPLSKLELLIAAMLLMTNFSAATGGYIFLCYLVLFPYLLNSPEYRKLCIYMLIIFVLPVDWIEVLRHYTYPLKTSYLGGGLSLDNAIYSVSLGSIIRPVCNFCLLITFALQLSKKYSRRGISGPSDAHIH